jgi:hypothetical protein
MERLPLRTQSIRAGGCQRQRFVLLPASPTGTGQVDVLADDRWPVRVTVGTAHHARLARRATGLARGASSTA